MIKFMDEITEAITGAVRVYMECVGEIAIYILGLLAKGLILFSTPVWILPYILIRDILRDNNGGKFYVEAGESPAATGGRIKNVNKR